MENLTGKKVLIAITKSNWGGAQTYVYAMAKGARDAGALVTITAGSATNAGGDTGQLFSELEQEGIRAIPLATMRRDVGLLSEWHSFRELIRIFKQERPDVLHLNSSKMGALGCIAGRLAGIRTIIFTSHGWAFNETRPWWQRVSIKLICAITIYGSTRTICVSDALRRDMGWLPFSQRKLIVIRNGIQPFDIMPREEARAKLVPETGDTIWLGMFAELHPVKRIEDAIDALEHVRTTYPNLALVVLGEGEQRAFLQQRALERGVEKHVFLRGFVLNAPSYLRAFDVFLMPSRSEALGYALLEAGYASLPVVASKVGGIPEIIENHYTGLLVPPQNSQDLAFSILSLLDDPDQARILGSNLHRRVLQEFMAERMVSETLALY